ncbi:helix-turn-helix domain-containing protein [Niabella hirudinis]|uniref:helix-turn-helix domain-containing protein n=1 Tax=Niabella hirudinis TaxID=1285929 RepID=UPI003EB6F966
MKRQFEDLKEITDLETYKKVMAYVDEVERYATKNGYLAELDADNKYTREMARVGRMAADYESLHMKFKHIKVKNPLIISIERQMEKKELNQRQTAALLEVKENTLSQIMSGKRSVSMQMAKRLYNVLKIDPKTIIEFA